MRHTCSIPHATHMQHGTHLMTATSRTELTSLETSWNFGDTQIVPPEYPEYAHLRTGVWKTFEFLSNCTMMSFSTCTHTPADSNRRLRGRCAASPIGHRSAHLLGDLEPSTRHRVKVMHDVRAVPYHLVHLALRRNALRPRDAAPLRLKSGGLAAVMRVRLVAAAAGMGRAGIRRERAPRMRRCDRRRIRT